MTDGGFEVVTKRGEAPFNEARGPRPSRGAQISGGGYRGGNRGGRGGRHHEGGEAAAEQQPNPPPVTE
jgi:hypothetical protein